MDHPRRIGPLVTTTAAVIMEFVNHVVANLEGQK
jgi:hypothetical protein